jgi:hypothetical protein
VPIFNVLKSFGSFKYSRNFDSQNMILVIEKKLRVGGEGRRGKERFEKGGCEKGEEQLHTSRQFFSSFGGKSRSKFPGRPSSDFPKIR